MWGFLISGINKEFVLLYRIAAETWDNTSSLLHFGPVAT